VPKDGGAPRATLVYDTECGTCSRFAALVRRLDTRGSLTLISMHDAGVEARLRPQLREAYDRSFHLVNEADGEVASGEEALRDLARLLPPVAPFFALVFKTPGVCRVPAAVYRAFAAGRTCSLPSGGARAG